jgi:pantoate--beta-alanine ligase
MGEFLSTDIKVIETCDLMRLHCRQQKSAGKSLGVVPTMGALHAGHLSLVSAANHATDETIVTIFVNPTQFAPGEDLEKYPRDLAKDLEKLRALGVATVFAPTNDEMYPPGCSTRILPGAVANQLEGQFRPIHFSGVATIVLKLLNLTSADKAFFGQKDFQQLLVVKRMVADLNSPTEIVACPIVRESDGLAMSSRNIYLSADERSRALSLHRTLQHAQTRIRDGERDGHALMSEMKQLLIDGGVSSIDYAVVANPDTLENHDTIELPAVVLVAARVGKTRLIDNILIHGD